MYVYGHLNLSRLSGWVYNQPVGWVWESAPSSYLLFPLPLCSYSSFSLSSFFFLCAYPLCRFSSSFLHTVLRVMRRFARIMRKCLRHLFPCSQIYILQKCCWMPLHVPYTKLSVASFWTIMYPDFSLCACTSCKDEFSTMEFTYEQCNSTHTTLLFLR